MRVIYTYRNFWHLIQRDNPVPVFLFITAALAWKKQYPKDTVVFYVDSTTERYLSAIPVEFRGWDELHVLDFDKEFAHVPRLEGQWCWPRLCTAFLEKEPCIISDIDVVICGKFKPENTHAYWGCEYYYDDQQLGLIDTCRELKDTLCKKYISGGLIYHPDPEMLHELTGDILNFHKNPAIYRFIERVGISEYMIIFEQGYPVSFYKKHNVDCVSIKQSSSLSDCLNGSCSIYHAMRNKYTENTNDRLYVISNILRVILKFSDQTISQFCQAMHWSEDFTHRVLSADCSKSKFSKLV